MLAPLLGVQGTHLALVIGSDALLGMNAKGSGFRVQDSGFRI